MGSISELHYDSDPPSRERPAVYGWENSNAAGYTINEIPSGTRRPLRVIVVGAGAAGISFAKFFDETCENISLTIYDKNEDVGGTWYENRYPGCACDIPSVTYQYTWEPNNWSKYYSEAPEIHAYFKRVVDKYGLLKFIKLRHRIDIAEWEETSAQWKVKVSNLADGTAFEDHCDVFINAGGILNYWHWPKDIDGLHEFQGIMAHTAAYPEGLDLKDKRVAVVGTGSSGIQIITKIQPDVEKLYTWVRSPTWMTSGYAQGHAGPNGTNIEYSEEVRNKFITDPDWYLKYRKVVEFEMSDLMAIHKNTPAAKASQIFAETDMRAKLKSRPDLQEALIPKMYPVGCRRPTPGNGYLEALISKNVTLYPGEALKAMGPNGFIDPDGHEIEIDVLILATGFNTSWVPRFPIIANGRNLQDIYSQNPLGYLGIAAPSMPNYFTFYAPYGPAGQGSVLPMTEFMTKYILQILEKMQVENIRSLTPKAEAIAEYGEHTDVWQKRMVWDAPCRSWMKGGTVDGKVMLYCGSRAQYMELISRPRYEDFDIKYRSMNRWNWLGNGFCQRDVNGQDITFFWGLVDGIDEQRDYLV